MGVDQLFIWGVLLTVLVFIAWGRFPIELAAVGGVLLLGGGYSLKRGRSRILPPEVFL